MSDVYEKSPNRMNDSKVRTAVEEVANFVSGIPEYGVAFEANTFALKTQKQVDINDTQCQAHCEVELDTISKNVESHLKDEGYKKVKVTPVDGSYDYHPLASNTWRGVSVVISKTYELEAEV